MAAFKPLVLNLASSLAEAFDASVQSDGAASAMESLQFSPGGVKRLRGSNTFTLEVRERDLTFLGRLGTGASSIVYKALLSRSVAGFQPRYVAVKKVCNLNEELRKQMKKDVCTLMDAARAATTLHAPPEGMVTFEGAYMSSEAQEVAIVLEYMNAGSLEGLLKQEKRIAEPVLAEVARMVLRGLFYLHKHMHVVHRDIKPANILLNMAGEAKIADFGISQPLDSTAALCTTYQGTAIYMSPERGLAQPYGFASDIWSLGLCLVECATGKYPYNKAGGPITLITSVRPSHAEGVTVSVHLHRLNEAERLQEQQVQGHSAVYNASALQIAQDVAPLPPTGKFSEELRDFCAQCLQHDPALRPTAAQLLAHPFVAQSGDSTAQLAACVRRAGDAPAMSAEAAHLLIHQYYQLLTCAVTSDAATMRAIVAAIEPLYAQHSAHSFRTDSSGGTTSRGAQQIATQLLHSLHVMKRYGVTHFSIKDVECTGMPGGAGIACLRVRGHVHAAHGTDEFQEQFELQRCGEGEQLCITNQSFSVLPGSKQ